MLSDIRYRLRAIVRRRAMERELAQELQAHLERDAASRAAAGLSPEDARREASAALGGIEQVKEACRDARGVSTIDAIRRDVRYALRQVRRSPGFTAVVVLSLALGIGANTAIFTLIDAVLLRSLPVSDPAQLHFVERRQPSGDSFGFGYDDFRRLQGANPVFTALAAYATTRINVSIDGSVEPTAEGHLVSGDYFPALGVIASAGRTLGPDDNRRPNSHPVAMLSDSYWNRRFGRDRAVIGRTITLSGTPFTIVGITPREFFGLEVGRAADLFVPVMMQPTVMPAAENWLEASTQRSFWLTVVGRLPATRPAREASELLGRLDVLEPLMTKPAPGEASRRIAERLTLTPAAIGLSTLRQQFSTSLLILSLAVAVVLLIACANVASLILARSASRTTEFSMRLALGAGRGQLIRQLLVENVMLAVIGGLGGLALAGWGTSLLVALMSTGRAPIVLDLRPDWRVLTFTAIVSLVTGVLCGIAPALLAGRVDVIEGMRPKVRGSGAGHWFGAGRFLVVTEVALCLILLFGAGLFVRSLQRLDPGDARLDRESVLIMRVEPKGSDQRGVAGASERLDAIYRDLIRRVEALPGIRSATMAHYEPTRPVGYAEPVRTPSGAITRVAAMMVYPKYFTTMGITLRGGRDLEERDLGANSERVALVSQAYVRHIMGGENPVGRDIPDPRGSSRRIIGVVDDSSYANLRGDAPPLIYQPFLQTHTGRGQMTLHVRAAADARDVAGRIRAEVQRIDPGMPLVAVETLAAQVNGVLSRERLVATLATLFGAVALLLACVGLYGLMAFAVVGRTGELGIRMALGATRGGIVRLILRDALLLVVAGLAIGAPMALVLGRLSASRISGLIFGLSTTDPLTMAGAAVLLTIVGALAASLPAARAARVDPMIALRRD